MRIFTTSLGTQRCQGYRKLLPPFTRTWTILPLLKSTQSLNLVTSRGSPDIPHLNLRKIGPVVSELWSDKQTEITFYILYIKDTIWPENSKLKNVEKKTTLIPLIDYHSIQNLHHCFLRRCTLYIVMILQFLCDFRHIIPHWIFS